MSKKQKQPPKREHTEKEPRRKTATFLEELPLEVHAGQAKQLPTHLEAGRQFYNALLSEGQKRLQQMRADPGWQAARAITHARTQERAAAFCALREQRGFSEYALQAYGKIARCTWIAEYLDAVLAQTLASHAYQALGRVCVGNTRRVPFKSRGRALSSIQNKHNDTGASHWRHPERSVHAQHETVARNRSRSGFISVRAALVSSSATYTRRVFRPTSIQQNSLPRVRSHVVPWEGAGVGGEARLRAAHEQVQQRANEGQSLPRSFGQIRAGARRPQSRSEATPGPAFLLAQGKLEAWKHRSEPREFSVPAHGVG